MISGKATLARALLKARFVAVVASLLAGPVTMHAAESAPKGLPIARVKRSATVDFEREVLPILKNNCLACHNQTKPKGGLILETPQDIRKGGDAGPAVVPKKPLESLLLTAAAHQDPELIMPPADNKVAAANLKPDELGLLQLWIEQGAAGEVRAAPPVAWQPIPPGLKSIYAAALTRDGQFAACGRANQVFVYHLPTGRLASRLDDPQLRVTARASAGAHRDVVNSLAFSPDGTLLASGGYREVKLWRRGEPREIAKFPASTGHVFPMSNGQWLTVSTNGSVRMFNAGGKATTVASLGAGIACVDLTAPPERLVIGRSNRVEFLSLTGGVTLTSVDLPFSILSVAALAPGRVAVACGDSLVRVVAPGTNRAALEVVQEISSPEPVTFLDAVPSATNRLIAGSADGSVRVWDLAHGKVMFSVAQPSPLSALALRPDGEFFATAGPNGARLWKMNQTNAVAEIRGDGPALFRNQEAERELTFARAEVEFRKASLKLVETNHIAAMARQSKAAGTNTALAKLAADKQGALTNALAAQRAAEQAVEELPPDIKKLVDAITAAETESTNAAALAKAAKDRPDKAKAEQLAAQAEAKAKLLEEARAQLDKLPAETNPKPKVVMDKVRAAIKTVSDAEKEFKRSDRERATSENELELATASLKKADAALDEAKRSVADARAQRAMAESGLKSAQESLSSMERPITTLSFSTDGSTLIGGDGSRLRTWSATTGTPLQTIETKSTRTVASADGSVIAVSGSAAAAWNLRPGWRLERVIGTGDERSPLADRVNALRFTADGNRLFSGGGEPTRGGEIKLWRVRDGSLVRDLANVHSDSVLALDLSPDGKFLASGAADRFAKVIDLSSGKVTRTFEGHTHHVLGLAWKRDGRTLVTAGADNVAKVWDTTTGERRKNLDSFAKEVTAAQFLGVTDELLVSAGDGQVVLVKDKGEKVRSFAGASDYVYATAVTADGGLVVAGGADGVLRVWNGRDGKVAAEFPAP